MLTYEKYNDQKLAVRGDKDSFHNLIKNIGGRWNSRMKGGEGWLLPVSEKDKLIKLINSLDQKNTVKNNKKEYLNIVNSILEDEEHI
jgi:hypothetical protein